MTNIIEEAEIINAYLCQIKKSLPLGIRLKRNELNDILDEIEDHIWEIAIESAGDNEPNELDVQIAISQMGEPQNIANKFTNRSTPHVYISEELYPSYKKYRKILFWSSILVFVFYAFFTTSLEFQSYLFSYFKVYFIIGMYFTSIIIIDIVFCYLSMTGYMPHELRKSTMQKKYSNIAQIRKPKFKSRFHIFFICLEISFFLYIAIFIVFWVDLVLMFLILSIIKILRGFTKTKSVMWQRSLIIADICFTFLVFWGVEGMIFSWFEVNMYFYFSPVPQEIVYILPIILFVLILYTYYDLYLFITLKEKQDQYLKELSLIKRIKKKDSILGTLKNHEDSSTPNIARNKQILSIESSEIEIDIEYTEVIKTYLKKVKRKLPFWLKRAEKRDVIKKLENEIREVVLDFKESSQLTQENLKYFLANLGNIKIILSEYKQQGTPKIFISKELWSWYLTTLKSFLVYFILISIFFFILEGSLNASFWFLWIFILIIATQLFTFFSLHDIIPENTVVSGRKKNKTPKFNLYNIWEALFAGAYIIIGAILIFLVFLREYSNFEFFFSGFLLLLGGVKISKIAFRQKKVTLKSVLIILSLVFSLVINFVIFYNLHEEHRVIFIIPVSTLLNLLLLPINIEIIYETFHFFFKNKKLYD